MRKKNGISKTVMENAARYALIFLAVIVTPFLAKPVAKLFDWAVLNWSQEGQLRPFFVELFTGIFWLAEFVVFLFLDKYLKKRLLKKPANAENNNVDVNAGENMDENAIESAENVLQETATADAATKNVDKGKTKQRKQTPLLPLKNVGILFLIAAACIVVVTLQIGFKVKPFYELGDKTTYTQILIKGGEIFRNLVKCVWIVALLKTSLRIMEGFLADKNADDKRVKWLKWLGVCGLLLLFGICDVIVFANPFAWTYILFYVAFTAVYFFTAQAPVKSFLLILFIYIF